MNKIAMAEGYAPFIIPKEERTQYMNLLADCNTDGLKQMIQKLMQVEIERLKQFDIHFEDWLALIFTVLEKKNFAVFQCVKDSDIFHSLQLLANSTLGRLLFAELTEQIGCLRKTKDIDGLKKLLSNVLHTCNGMFNGKAYDSLSNKDLLKDIVIKESDS